MIERVVRERSKGWHMPEGAIYVGRPSPWGNPFPLTGDMAVWLALASGERADDAGRRRSAVAWYRWWVTGMTGEMPVKTREDASGGELEYTNGSVRKVADIVTGMGVMMLSQSPIMVPKPPDLTPLREAAALACWCPVGLPCHADVLIELLA